MTAPVADLHMHTHFSDGALSPQEIVQKARDVGLLAVAITDHDTLKGIKEAEQAARRLAIQVVAGVELSAEYGDKELHVVGLFIDDSSVSLRAKLKLLRDQRRERIFGIVERLAELGVHIEPESIFNLASGDSVGRPHVAEALRRQGVVTSKQEAFARYLAGGAPAYVPRRTFNLEESCRLIRQAGGAAIWAHPGEPPAEDELKELMQRGVQGVEAYSPMHSEKTCAAWLELARAYGLMVSGGSDFHDNKRKPVLMGAMGLSKQEFEILYDKVEQSRR